MVLVPGTVVVLLPWLVLGSDSAWARHDGGPFRWLGVPIALIGFLAYLPCLQAFIVRGRGTPSPLDPPQKLVTLGIYRFVRNPMYVTVGVVLIGEIVFFGSLALLAFLLAFWLVVHAWTVVYEEPTLRRQFGTSYKEYCSRVNRWIPRPR